MKKYRVAVIGCGMIAKRLHVPDFAVCRDAEVAALCDAAKAKAQALAAEWAPGARIYTDYRRMLDREDLDGVVVALPNDLHAAVTIAMLRAGCDVLVEKPMATSSAEARRMIDAARKAGKLLMVNQCQRLMALHRKAKEVVDSGVLGRIVHVATMYGHEGPEYWSPTSRWFFRRREARFGAMGDIGVHKADLVRYLTGKEVAEVSAYRGCLAKKRSDVDDNFVSCLTFADGTLGTLCASWTVRGGHANYVMLHGLEGSLYVNVFPGRPLVAHLGDPRCVVDYEVPEPAPKYQDSWCMDVGDAFVRAARGQQPPFCSGEEGRKTLEVILAAEKSAVTGRSVPVKL